MFRFFYFLLSISLFSYSQDSQNIESQIKSFYDHSLTSGKSYEWLEHLSNQIGGRLSGSLNAERAVQWSKEELESLGLDKVWLQPVMVPKWVRGNFEYASIESSTGNSINVSICALGGSVATPNRGIRAEVIEVKSFVELKKLGVDKIAGKIVFFNRPMDPTKINTFSSYSGAVNQRTEGAEEAIKLGAKAVLVRSMNLSNDDFPHTGSMYYGSVKLKDRIPAAAISTNGANLLSSMLKLDPKLKFFIKQNCQNYPDVLSYNVIGEIKGSEFPNKIILVGGHLDSWDLGDGSHDDGAGVVQSMEVLNQFKSLGVKPRHTLRVVLFMNEENGLRGGSKYANIANKKREDHLFALESDAGGFTPRGFSFDSSDSEFDKIKSWKKYFKPYLINEFTQGGGGADIGPLKSTGTILSGLRPDSQRYFDYHHSSQDTFDAINKRELEIGAASMSSLIYLVDIFGF
ncbi:MAG: hypothetical protein ACI914_000514 [Candidatus Marivariicella framensis]|jgi:hypothetical protein|tara:strand:+ start:8170 stop:9546 length:1377 start_codon:yes stop_codon:yes gene_type:complete